MAGTAEVVRTRRACPVCGSRSGAPLHRQEFVVPDQHPLAGGYLVVCCTDCGGGFADSDATRDDYAEFYRSFNKYATQGPGTVPIGSVPRARPAPALTRWDAARLDATADLLVRRRGTAGLFVDVGCGNGYLLHALHQRGVRQLAGLDPAPGSAVMIDELPDSRGHVGGLGTVPRTLVGKADVVTLCHVLEHVWDMAEAMLGLRSLLAPDGVVYVEVPDAGRFDEYLAVPFHDFNTEHVNHFSPTVLDTLMARAGFDRFDGGAGVVGCAPALDYPMCWGLYTLGHRSSRDAPPPTPDRELREALERYVARSHELSRAVLHRVAETVASRRDGDVLTVWGTGELTQKLLTSPELAALAPGRELVLVDGSPVKQGLRLAGTQVSSPTVLTGVEGPVVIGSVHAAAGIAAAAIALGVARERLVFLPGAVA